MDRWHINGQLYVNGQPIGSSRALAPPGWVQRVYGIALTDYPSGPHAYAPHQREDRWPDRY